MANRLYLMPIIGDGVIEDRRPKYLTPYLDGLSWAMWDYGLEPLGLVRVRDIPDATHLAMAAAATDLVLLPANIDQPIGAQLGQVQTQLEALNIPGGWVQASFTYRQVLRVVGYMFHVLQRLNRFSTSRLFNGRTLATRINQLPAGLRAQLDETLTSFGFNTALLTGPMTLRTALKLLADQFGNIEFILAGDPL